MNWDKLLYPINRLSYWAGFAVLVFVIQPLLIPLLFAYTPLLASFAFGALYYCGYLHYLPYKAEA